MRRLFILLFMLGRAAWAAAPAPAPVFAPVAPLPPGQTLRMPADAGAHPDHAPSGGTRPAG